MIYERCDEETIARVHRMISRNHEELARAKVTLSLLFVAARRKEDKLVGAALTHQGYAAHAVARVVNLRDRAKGNPDVEIVFDFHSWSNLSPKSQDALIDHELTHFLVVADEFDAAGRPKIRLKKHDFQVGWFHAVASRHGAHAIEAIQSKLLVDSTGQLYFAWLPKDSPARREFQKQATAAANAMLEELARGNREEGEHA